VIVVKEKGSEKYKITNLRLARQFLVIKIYHNEIGTGIGLTQKTYITKILRWFGMEHSHGVLIPLDRNVTLNMAKNRGKKELKGITDY
jgi:hypothetical protein